MSRPSALPRGVRSLSQVVRSFESRVGSALEQVIGFTTSDMDARFEVIRSAESNMGNLVCDVLRAATRADMVVVNAGEGAGGGRGREVEGGRRAGMQGGRDGVGGRR